MRWLLFWFDGSGKDIFLHSSKRYQDRLFKVKPMSIVWDCTTELFHVLKHFDSFYPKCECFCIKSRPQMTVPSVKADVWSIVRVFPCSGWTLKAFTNWNRPPFRIMRTSCCEKVTILLFESSAISPNFRACEKLHRPVVQSRRHVSGWPAHFWCFGLIGWASSIVAAPSSQTRC